MQPIFSIIIPTYNRAHLIGETLESVLAQTHKNWECLVIDDGSTDYTPELMRFYCLKHSAISYYHRPKKLPKGTNSCRNYGFELSKGEYINWFDDDDVLMPEKLELQLNSLMKNTGSDYSVCNLISFEDSIKNKLIPGQTSLESERPFEDYLKMHIGWLTNAVLWRRIFLIRLEYLFDEELMAAQEWEFHCRALAISTNYVKTPEPLYLHRKHKSSISYSHKEEERYWNYFLARLIIYRNKAITLNKGSRNFLKNYLLNSYKNMVREQNPFVFQSFLRYIFKEPDLSTTSKLCAYLSILSYRFLNKGNVFIKRIKYRL